jgi:hypothetical protein
VPLSSFSAESPKRENDYDDDYEYEDEYEHEYDYENDGPLRAATSIVIILVLVLVLVLIFIILLVIVLVLVFGPPLDHLRPRFFHTVTNSWADADGVVTKLPVTRCSRPSPNTSPTAQVK